MSEYEEAYRAREDREAELRAARLRPLREEACRALSDFRDAGGDPLDVLNSLGHYFRALGECP